MDKGGHAICWLTLIEIKNVEARNELFCAFGEMSAIVTSIHFQEFIFR